MIYFDLKENQYSGGFEYSGDQLNLDQTPKHFGGLENPNVYSHSKVHLQPLPPLEPGQYLTSTPALPPAHYVTTNFPMNSYTAKYDNGNSTENW